MMGEKRILRRGLFALGVLILTGAAAPPKPGASLPALARLEPGLWQIREFGGGTKPLSICVADPAMLTQIQHRQTPCSRIVIASDRNGATVHYTCPTNGFGHTSVRIETPRLAKIDTQGMMDNIPFAFRAEARRIGPCP
jgi:hypothetical protein